jgi:hypothetical protein
LEEYESMKERRERKNGRENREINRLEEEIEQLKNNAMSKYGMEFDERGENKNE